MISLQGYAVIMMTRVVRFLCATSWRMSMPHPSGRCISAIIRSKRLLFICDKRVAIAGCRGHRMLFSGKESVKAESDGFLVINHKYISHLFLPLRTPLTRKDSAVLAPPLHCNLNCSFVPRHTWEVLATWSFCGQNGVSHDVYVQGNQCQPMRPYFLEMASSTSF